MLRVEGISRIFGDKKVVNDLSFTVEDGEFVALLGPSGCGKSTSLKMIAGLENPDSGLIELDGKDITHLDHGKRKLGMVFQSYALFPHLSVKENILFGLKARKVPKEEQKKRLTSVIDLVTNTVASRPLKVGMAIFGAPESGVDWSVISQVL